MSLPRQQGTWQIPKVPASTGRPSMQADRPKAIKLIIWLGKAGGQKPPRPCENSNRIPCAVLSLYIGSWHIFQVMSDARLSRYLKRLDDADKEDEDTAETGTIERLREKITEIQERRKRLDGHDKALAKSGEDQISLTDTDARAMHSSSRVGVGYNIQIAVDTKHKLIAKQQVHNNVSDLGLLTETAEAARTNLGLDEIDAVANRSYF